MRKKTQEEFEAAVAKTSPNTEIIGTYDGTGKPVAACCRVCGHEWAPFAASLLRGSGCPVCARCHRLSVEELQRRVDAKHRGVKISGAYVNQKSRMHCECEVCGYIWETSAASLSRGAGCRRCAGLLKKTTNQFQEEIKRINPSVELIDEYVNDGTPITFRCRECGWVWETPPRSVLQGSGCPKCAGVATRNTVQFIAELAEANPDIEVLGNYVTTDTKTALRCRVCGFEWETTPGVILHQGCGCPRCGIKRNAEARRKTHEEFVAQLAKVNTDIEVIGKYEAIHEKVALRCGICGSEWEAEPNSVLQGTGCPECFHGATSFAEQFLRFALEAALGADKVLSRDRTIIGRELDIVVPSANCALEYGAWHWHKDKVMSDREKLSLCEDKGVFLLVVYEGYPDDAPPFEGCRVYARHLGELRMRSELKALASEVIERCGASAELSESQWEEVARVAARASRKTDGQ